MTCRLCQCSDAVVQLSAGNRHYFVCPHCSLININKEHLPDKAQEKERYLTHNNGIQFKGYVDFLSKAINPALQFLHKDMTGLDYGCGYEPTLSRLVASHGYACEDYDPFFAQHPLSKKFDFIFSTEVFEHFFYPCRDILHIHSLLSKGGVLVIMTKRWEEVGQFSKWYYAGDPTHVCFYHSKTFDFICTEFGFEKLYDDDKDLIILKTR